MIQVVHFKLYHVTNSDKAQWTWGSLDKEVHDVAVNLYIKKCKVSWHTCNDHCNDSLQGSRTEGGEFRCDSN